MEINSALIEEITENPTYSGFNKKYNEDTQAIIAILRKIYNLSYSQIREYMQKEHGIDIPKNTLPILARKSIKILDEKIKTDKKVKNYDWYPFYSKSPIKNALFKNDTPESASLKNSEKGYQEESVKEPDLPVKKGTKKSPQKSQKTEETKKKTAKIEEDIQDIEVIGEILEECPADQEESLEIKVKQEKEKKLETSKKENPLASSVKTSQPKTKKRTSSPRKSPPQEEKKIGQNSVRKVEEKKTEAEPPPVNNNDNENRKEKGSSIEKVEEPLECEVIGRPAEDIMVVWKSLEKKERHRRQSVVKELTLKLDDEGKLSKEEMNLLYKYTKVNAPQNQKEVNEVVFPELRRIFGDNEVDELLKKRHSWR